MAIETKPEIKEAPARVAPTGLRGPVKEAFLITSDGLDEMVGGDALELEQKIKADKKHSASEYKHFDGDKHVWAYWAVADPKGDIMPLNFPGLLQYNLTAPQLYTKAVTYPRILAHAVGLLKDKTPSMWDKMMKPTTIIVAIVGIILVIALFMVAAQG